jgi:tight adherence protein C
MSPMVTGGLVGAAAGGGLLLIVLGAPWRRRPALDDRVLPYLAELRSAADYVPTGSVPGTSATVSALVGPWLRRLATAMGRLIGGGADVRRRLARAGSELDVEELRVEQVTWGLLAAAATAGLGLAAALRGSLAPAPLVVGVLAAFLVGLLARDWRLSQQVAAREEAVLAELPAVVELLALSVAAGEGPVAALERVTKTARGAFPSDLRELLGHVSTGTPVAAALDHLAARTGVVAVTRFASTLAVAVDRGTPLVDVLHAQAADVREAGRRSLLETGARKEVLMMVPVVFFVLPVTVVFAFFPGVVGLQLTTP